MPTPVWMKKVEDKAADLEAKAKADAAALEAWALHGKDAAVVATKSLLGSKFLWPVAGGVLLVIGYVLL